MRPSLKTLATITLGASALISTTAFAGACGSGDHADSYNFTPITNGTRINVSLRGFGVNRLPNKLMTGVSQSMELKPDCTFTSIISVTAPVLGLDNMAVFTLNGSWSYPGESKLIYFTIDGDISKGAAAGGTWGTLFDPDQATGIPQFFSLLINPAIPDRQDPLDPTKVRVTEKVATPLVVVYPSVSLQKGYIQLSKNGTQATITTLIGGKSIATPGANGRGVVREADFAFGAITKATTAF